jgi:hypothetical protein
MARISATDVNIHEVQPVSCDRRAQIDKNIYIFQKFTRVRRITHTVFSNVELVSEFYCSSKLRSSRSREMDHKSTGPIDTKLALLALPASVQKRNIKRAADDAGFMMGWTPRRRHRCAKSGGVEHHLREASVSKAVTIGLDIAKHVFHAHGVDERGLTLFSKRISRGKLLDFFAAQPNCLVVLEACGGAHHWARQLIQLGHQVRLIPPAYLKPFVKRQKNDAIDAEAFCEGAQRPNMRFVAVKSEAAGGRSGFSNSQPVGAATNPTHQRNPGTPH